jgi:type II secretory pathway pseudopilin PulG
MHPRRLRKSERGMTLIEALIAMLIFVTVFMAALALYTSANKAYLQTDAATILQQNVRFAMDRVVLNTRDAGTNVNPLGSNSLADEQLEGAWESAIFVRGDFDNSREGTLENSTYPIVSTGNDEIVGYVLMKPGANTRPINLSLDLEPAVSGGGRDSSLDHSTDPATPSGEEPVTINVAARTLAEQTDPPYQLARVTFEEDGDPKIEIVAENVFRLEFQYLDANGTELITSALEGGDNDERDDRANVRRIAIDLIGMADRPDLSYTDPVTYVPAAPADTIHFRKFRMRERVWPVNLGLEGKIHNPVPTLDYPAPASITVCTGHCRNYHVTWPATTAEGITHYRVHITSDAGFERYVDVEGLSLDFEQANDDPDDYTFAVAPLSNIGVEGNYSPSVTHAATHEAGNSIPTAPSAAATAVVSTSALAMNVTWPVVSTNTTSLTELSCKTSGTGTTSQPTGAWASAAVDLGNYRIYRARYPDVLNGTFSITDYPQVQEKELGELENTPTDETQFIDHTAAPCSQYFYRIQAVDLCNISGGASPGMAAAAAIRVDDGVVPEAPAAPTAVTLTSDGTNYHVLLKWDPVTRTAVTNRRAAVDHYMVTRKRMRPTLGETTYVTDPSFTNIHVRDAVQMQTADTAPLKTDTADTQYQYNVHAVYDCGDFSGDTNRVSAASPPFTIVCLLPADTTVGISKPTANDTITRPYESSVPLEITVGGSGTWGGATIEVLSGSTVVATRTMTGAPTSGKYAFTPAWDASSVAPGVYTIRGRAKQGSCTKEAAEITITVNDTTCGLKMVTTGADTPVWSGNGSNLNKTLTFKVENTCTDFNITITGFTPTWSGGPNALLTRLTTLKYGNTNLRTGALLTSGQEISIASSSNYRTIAAGTTSTEAFQFIFSQTMKNTLASTTFSQITATTSIGTDTILESSLTP